MICHRATPQGLPLSLRPPPLYGNIFHISRITGFDASPQLQTVKKFVDAYHALDMNRVEPFISENYQYYPFPDSADLPKTTKEGHIQMFRGILSTVDKADVRIWRTALKPTNRYLPPLGYLSQVGKLKAQDQPI